MSYKNMESMGKLMIHVIYEYGKYEKAYDSCNYIRIWNVLKHWGLTMSLILKWDTTITLLIF